MRLLRHALAAAVFAAAGATGITTANAHDTWFERLPAATGQTLLALGTGTVYPLFDSGIDAKYLARQGCRGARRSAAMQPLRNEPASLVLRAGRDAATCWAQLTPFEIELPADKIGLYLREINASTEVRAAWADIHARGLPWKERYTKHARIALGNGLGADQPVPMAMDVVLEQAPPPLRSGQNLRFRVLREGRPLPDFAIELRSETSRFGIWRRTDAEGRAEVPLPFAGTWMLRGTDLHLSATQSDAWESRFVTLIFEVAPAGGQNDSSLTLNARSTSQMAATIAISAEPPSSTARR